MARTIETTPTSDLSDDDLGRYTCPRPRRRHAAAIWVLVLGAVAGVAALAFAVASDDSSPAAPRPAIVETSDTTIPDPLITRFGRHDDAQNEQGRITRF